MQNLKIRVNNKAESDEVQEFLKSIGYHRPYSNFVLHDSWVCFNQEHQILCVCNSQAGKELEEYKEITLSELRAMVNQDQDEPFLTPECTLNYQYAEIEQVRQQTIESTLAERQSTYGNFEDVAFVTENIMSILARVRPNGLQDLPNTHRMALYMIASKMARIVNGDFNHLDSWHDIGGYAKLVEKLIDGE